MTTDPATTAQTTSTQTTTAQTTFPPTNVAPPPTTPTPVTTAAPTATDPTTGAGLGTTSTATPAPQAAPAAHVETWAYDDCGNGGTTAGAAVVRSWVTYAEANCGPQGVSKAMSDCHGGGQVFCNVIAYLDTNWIYPGSSPTWSAFNGAAAESWYQHLSSSPSQRVATSSWGGGYLINQANPAVASFFGNYARANYDGVDGLMMDDQSAGMSAQLWSSNCSGCTSDNELHSDSALIAAHGAVSTAMTHTSGQRFVQIDNALAPNPYLPQGFDLINASTGVVGMIGEGEPENNGQLDPYYSTLLDQIAYVANNTNGFIAPLSYAPAGAAYQQQSRRVQEATILLGYSPGHLVDWADLENTSTNLGIWPEEGIYPTQPLQTMHAPGGSGCLTGSGNVCATGGHNDLQVAPGIYRREYAACDNQGTPIGPCAAIVNTTTTPTTVNPAWLTQTYTHQITFTGGDVQSGGTINTTGATFTPGATPVAADDAVILAQ